MTSAAPGPDPRVIDPQRWAALDAMVGGDPAILAHLVEVFATRVPDRVAELRAAHVAGDAERLRMAAHATKGAAANLGATAAAAAAADLELAAAAADPARTQALVEPVVQELMRAAEALQVTAARLRAPDGQ